MHKINHHHTYDANSVIESMGGDPGLSANKHADISFGMCSCELSDSACRHLNSSVDLNKLVLSNSPHMSSISHISFKWLIFAMQWKIFYASAIILPAISCIIFSWVTKTACPRHMNNFQDSLIEAPGLSSALDWQITNDGIMHPKGCTFLASTNLKHVWAGGGHGGFQSKLKHHPTEYPNIIHNWNITVCSAWALTKLLQLGLPYIHFIHNTSWSFSEHCTGVQGLQKGCKSWHNPWCPPQLITAIHSIHLYMRWPWY